MICVLLCAFSFIQEKRPKDLISQFERKIKIDTNNTSYFKKLNRCYIENGDSKGRQNSKCYFIFSKEGNKNVGTDIRYSLNNKITELGTWQTKTDSFMLSNTDTLIVFSNPFKKQYCHIEYNETVKAGAFSAGYVTGYAFEWTPTNKLKTETMLDEKGNTLVVKLDTTTGKILSKRQL